MPPSKKEMGRMSPRISWPVFLLMAGMAMAPAAALGQTHTPGPTYAPPDPVFPLPLYSNRPEAGGLYLDVEFLFWRQTNPLEHQVIARRGLIDFDGSISADLGGVPFVDVFEDDTPVPPIIIPGQGNPGGFIGSGRVALSADDASGPRSYQPGVRLGGGWRFRNGAVVDIAWSKLFRVEYPAVATLVPEDFDPGPELADSFLFAPVHNFPNEYAGPADKLALGNPWAAYGIWNGASIMEIIFAQEYTQFDITGRVPIFQTDCTRTYGLVGGRFAWFWERFQWRTISLQFDGQAGPDDAAMYTNIVSNRMFGPFCGMGWEWRLGDKPLGTFAVSLDLQAALLVDFVREIAKYERLDRFTAAKRSRKDYQLVPEVAGSVNLWWYPIEGIQLRVGYDVMAFFHTISSPEPVDFDFGALAPAWVDDEVRFIDGLHAGIAFIF
jgi:hypothetical protein